jgi:transposase
VFRRHPGVPDHPRAHPVRRDLTGERTREKQRAEKLLESAAVKLSCVVTDLHGVTGRDIMDHLIAGERNPKVLAQLARGRARRKIAELEHALEGAEFFTPQLAALLATMLARIDQLNVSIEELSAVIETLLEPYEEQLQQAGSMPGWGRRPAQDAIAETGVDMSRFRTGAHLASWAGKTPLDHQSGSRGVALGNTQMKVYHKLLSTPGMRYEDLGADYYDNRASTRRQIRALEKRARELGYALVPDLTGCPEAS